MSDDERDYSESEEEQEVAPEPEQPKIPEAEQPKKTEAELAMEEKMKKKQEEEEILWQEYLEQRQKQKQKEEEELRKLKERQAKRKAQRAEEEKRLIQIKRKQEEQRVREVEEKKAREAEAKKKRLEEAERKRQAMQQAMEKRTLEPIQRNFVITKREDGGLSSTLGHTGLDKMYARSDMVKSKEQLEEEKKVAMSIRIKPLQIEGLSVQDLRQKAQELWEKLVILESEKYDLEERKKRQDYDLKELSERQRQINRNKALKKGMDPDALQGKYPPKIQVASKYERRIDRRTFTDKKGMFEGGIETQNEGTLAKLWEERMMAFKDRGESKLPKWDPSTPKVKDALAPGKDDEDDLDLEAPPTFGGGDPLAAGNEEEEEEEDEEEEEEE